ncbi:MAG TPA: DUF5134 domain-containing protein [Solirubrobacterales bacterium]
MSMGHDTVNLLPVWIGVVGVMMFLLIAASHVLHLARASGERRWWHVSHVLMAVGMAFMYFTNSLDRFAIAVGLWQMLFAVVAVLVTSRALAGLTGLASNNPLWILTAIELGTMVYMWSSSSYVPVVTWALTAYLFVEAALWAVNAYRQIDHDAPLLGWTSLAAVPEAGAAVLASPGTPSLIGGLDISVSMTAMAIGMAYMLAAMQLVT